MAADEDKKARGDVVAAEYKWPIDISVLGVCTADVRYFKKLRTALPREVYEKKPRVDYLIVCSMPQLSRSSHLSEAFVVCVAR